MVRIVDTCYCSSAGEEKFYLNLMSEFSCHIDKEQ